MKIKILRTFIGNVNGASVRFREGEVRDVPDEAADHFVRGHYAERIDEPAVKIMHKPVEKGGKARIK